MTNDLPNNDDGNALRLMADRGIDMSQPVQFEFSILVEDQSAADTVLRKLNAVDIGDTKEIEFDEGELNEGEEMTEGNKEYWPSWTVYVSKSMVPNYASVVEFQETLAEVCKGSGQLDGWTVQVS